MYAVEPSTPDRVARIAANLRPADAAEGWSFWGRCPRALTKAAARDSDVSWVGLKDGEPFCVFGCLAGQVWLVATPVIEASAMAFLRYSRGYVARMHRMYGRLWNYVAQNNRVSLAWLRWLGFNIAPAAPAGVFGDAFHYVWLEADYALDVSA